MNRFLGFLAIVPMFAGDISYVVLNGATHGHGLVRVSEDGRTIEPIAPDVAGNGLAIDKNGDYIVAAVSRLLRVSRNGEVTEIARTPPGSQWMSVAIDSSGAYIVCDDREHAVWRVEPTGAASVVAHYPGPVPNLEAVQLVIDGTGDYFLIEENGPTGFHRITPEGQIQRIALRGDRIPHGGAIISDGAGGYLVASLPNQIFRLTPGGEALKFRAVPGYNLCGMARNPKTGELVVTMNFEPGGLLRVSADGSMVTDFARDPKHLNYPMAIVVDTGK